MNDYAVIGFSPELAGINPFVAGITGVFNCEMTHSESYYRSGMIAKKRVPDLQITSNADWWLSSMCEVGVVPAPFPNSYLLMGKGGAQTTLFLNEDGTVNRAHVFAPTLFSMMKARGLNDVEASKIATTTYYFTQKPDNQLTSIISYIRSVETGNENEAMIINNSWLDRQPWINAPGLSQTHGFLWRFFSGDNAAVPMTVRCLSVPTAAPGTYDVTVMSQYSGTMPVPQKGKTTDYGCVSMISVIFDDVDGPVFDIANSNVVLNRNHKNCWAVLEVWPSDHSNKRETDHSPLLKFNL